MAVIQYIVVRKDLINKCGIGFLAAQVAHASIAPITSQIRGNFDKPLDEIVDNETKEWINGTFTKVVLEVNNVSQLQQISEMLRKDNIAYSEIGESRIGNELTAIGLKPYCKSKVLNYFKGLPLLS